MIRLNPGRDDAPKWLVERVDELPTGATGARRLYLDFETNSFTSKRGGDNPWAGDRICGAALTWDDHPDAYYVPVRHTHDHWNLPVQPFQRWLKDVVESCDDWVNHNIKFDAHFAKADGAQFRGRLLDTLTLSKLIDSDRAFGRGGYGLDALSSDWILEPIDTHYQEVQAFLQGLRPASKNYADVPADILGSYACQDVLTNRKLYAHVCSERDRCTRETPRFPLIWEIETKLTPVLWDMEDDGLTVDPWELKKKQLVLMTELAYMEEKLHELTGYPLVPSNTRDCFEVLCNQFGLPVLSWTEEELHPDGTVKKSANPSFDKDTLKQYCLHPDVVSNDKYSAVLQMMLAYRKKHTLKGLFVEPFIERQVGGRLHPQYNQLVRTGRMSAKRPNSQQQNKDSKALIHPDSPDDEFLPCDASQIEFRLIAHYCKDRGVIDAYARDPDTDFHQWVADMCGIKRKPAKNVNFCIGYGGGKGKVLSMLSADMDLVGSLGAVVDKLVLENKLAVERRREAFAMLAKQRAENVYRQYHAALPGLRHITRYAADMCKRSGYVQNEYGRQRRMPEKAAWRAFNSVTQGLASDIIKGGMVAIAPRYCSWMREQGIQLKINVHDEVTPHGPREVVSRPEVQATIVRTLERVLVPLRVPIRFGCELGHGSWATDDKTDKQAVDRSLGEVLPSNVEWYEQQSGTRESMSSLSIR